MRKEKLGVGVIGLKVGESHLIAYQKNPYTEIRGICDTDRERLEQIANDYKIPFATEDYKELVSRNEIDIISIATPDFFHKEQSVFALNAGKNVLCEKPLAPNLKDCQEIVNASKKSKGKFMVGETYRFNPQFTLVKKLIKDGYIGELFLVEIEQVQSFRKVGGVGNWRKNPKRHPFIGEACHSVDLLRWIVGDVEEVFAYSNHKCLLDWPVDDCTMAALKFKDNTIGNISFSIGCVRPYRVGGVFYGTKGTIICDDANTSPFIQISGEHFPFAKIPVDIVSHNVSVSTEINEFVDCIIKNKKSIISAEEGAKTVAVAVATVQSTKEGKPIKVNYTF